MRARGSTTRTEQRANYSCAVKGVHNGLSGTTPKSSNVQQVGAERLFLMSNLRNLKAVARRSVQNKYFLRYENSVYNPRTTCTSDRLCRIQNHPGRSPKSYYKRSDEDAGQKMELAGTRPTHARAPAGAPSPVKLRQTYPRDAFRRRTKSKYRKRYKHV